MPDLETQMPELLRRAARGAPPRERLERRVLRRARWRRAVNASVAGFAAIALVLGTLLGVRGLLRSDGSTPADEAPGPSPSAGTVTLMLSLPGAVWPEVDQGSLEDAQARADVGELDWRLDPVATASTFATEVFGWDRDDVRAEETGRPRIGTAIVTISNFGLGPGADATGPAAPTTSIALRQLGEKGDQGIWTVVGADSDRIAMDPLPASVRSGETIEVSGSLSEVQVEWSGTLALLSVDPIGGAARIFPGELTGTISGSVRVPGDAIANVAVVVRLYDPEGTTVVADVVPIAVRPTADGGEGSTGSDGNAGVTAPTPAGPSAPATQIPGAVLATRDAIAIAAETRDYDLLESLIDADRFSYNFGDGSSPVPEWRKDPAVLDTLATILQLSFATAEGTRDVGTIYVWPSLVDADPTELTAEDRTDLEILGISERELQDMLDAFGGYVGPRTGISEDGTWVFYTIGGD